MNRILKASSLVFITIFILTLTINKTSIISIEAFYSSLYYYWYSVLSSVFVYTNFAIGDIIYILFPFFIILYFFRTERRRDKFYLLIKTPIIIYCVFYWSWGFNYNNQSNLQYLKNQNYSQEQVTKTLEYYIDLTNNMHFEISKTKEDKVSTNMTFKKITEECVKSIKKQNMIFDNRNIDFFPIKKSVFSTPLSYMGFSGYINPFTLEANINYNIPDISLPITITHEMAHQIGYAFEDEANFIAIYTLINSENEFLKYSGALMGVQYLLAEQKKYDNENFIINRKKLNLGVIKNLQEKNEYYLKYQNKYEEIFKKSYDKFLKKNNQKAGIRTYSLVVKMLINQHYQLLID